MSDALKIEAGFIVEGHGDVEAVPAVFRRIAKLTYPTALIVSPTPFRVPKDRLRRSGELERTVEFVARTLNGQGLILITVDSDNDLPCILGPELRLRASITRPDVSIGVAIAKREFESWFVGLAESIAGCRGLRTDLISHPDPENLRGAKEWLTRNMIEKVYRETRDQKELARIFDLNTARRRCPSFDKFFREVERLCHSAVRPVDNAF